ncbi:MAG: hypothetical protein HYT83_00060 [Candidatus Levybacteria bacterium]|nr:hypothetical protein [Candidatus Levybacteria bacterium]
MAKKSRALDGDWQGDGWGISYLSGNKWESYKSLLPVWEDTGIFQTFPKTSVFLIHARSASFPKDKGILEFNQPYVYKNYSFVFNGLLKGVNLSVPGRIGAEKIWYILRNNLDQYSPIISLQKAAELLVKSSKRINALNIGLSDGQKIYSYCYFTQNPEYYNLQLDNSNNLNIICSEELVNHHFKPLSPQKVTEL